MHMVACMDTTLIAITVHFEDFYNNLEKHLFLAWIQKTKILNRASVLHYAYRIVSCNYSPVDQPNLRTVEGVTTAIH